MTGPLEPPPATATFAVQAMTCAACVRHVEAALREHLPAAAPHVDLAAKQVTVAFDPAATSPAAIAKVLDEAGYPARPL